MLLSAFMLKYDRTLSASEPKNLFISILLQFSSAQIKSRFETGEGNDGNSLWEQCFGGNRKLHVDLLMWNQAREKNQKG